MWTDRYITYYSKDRQWAVRWLECGRPEEEAGIKRFDNKFEAERFYNQMATCPEAKDIRLELFFSQAKWIQYHSNRDEFGELRNAPIGESSLCVQGDHKHCTNPLAEACTCPCHHTVLTNQV